MSGLTAFGIFLAEGGRSFAPKGNPGTCNGRTVATCHKQLKQPDYHLTTRNIHENPDVFRLSPAMKKCTLQSTQDLHTLNKIFILFFFFLTEKSVPSDSHSEEFHLVLH